jgi:hypothetical protein
MVKAKRQTKDKPKHKLAVKKVSLRDLPVKEVRKVKGGFHPTPSTS